MTLMYGTDIYAAYFNGNWHPYSLFFIRDSQKNLYVIGSNLLTLRGLVTILIDINLMKIFILQWLAKLLGIFFIFTFFQITQKLLNEIPLNFRGANNKHRPIHFSKDFASSIIRMATANWKRKNTFWVTL